MAQLRRPRFVRSREIAPIRITDRDTEILRQIYRHRFLRTSQIAALVGGSRQQLARRLQWLFHHGYLERPLCQIDYYHRGGSREMIHGLANRGAGYLKHARKISVRDYDWSERNGGVHRLFLEHAIMVSDVTVSIELACRKDAFLAFHLESEIPLPEQSRDKRKPFQWTITLGKSVRAGVIPDRVFMIERKGAKPVRVLFCLEADRGTMPVQRANEKASSFWKKLECYSVSVTAGIPRQLFGTNRMRVLTVTTNFARLQHLREAASSKGLRRGLFLFACADDFTPELDPVTGLLWLPPGGDAPTSLFDSV